MKCPVCEWQSKGAACKVERHVWATHCPLHACFCGAELNVGRTSEAEFYTHCAESGGLDQHYTDYLMGVQNATS